ncbi:MAG: tRNA dihydrouridine synthase DusB [bacterium]|nr:tRNA dihydrouridine synthase DusB [bacterium]
MVKNTKNEPFSWGSIQSPFFVLAPLDGITSSPFRRVCKKLGADVVFSEMIAADAVFYKSEKTLKMMSFHEEERPYIIQIFGKDLEKMAVSAKWIEENIKPDGIDINMGCPAKKVVSGGRGSALLQDFDLALKIAKAVRDATKLPLSIKMRLGWDEFNIHEFAQRLEKIGVDAITIHGRTKSQGFKGEPDWKAIGEIKKLVSIPVIGNGNVVNAEDSKKIINTSGCDGVMVGRGALGNPWIFQSMKEGKDYKPTWEETVEVALWHLEMSVEEFGGKKGIFDMRKHYGWYFKGFDGASELRKKLVVAENIKEVQDILKK